jgi:hypothetical protein
MIMQKNLIQFLQYTVDNKNMRLGQAFCNFFSVTDAILFYEPDPQKSWEMILNNEKFFKYICENECEKV